MCLVTAPHMKDIRATLDNRLEHAIQEKPQGTAHAISYRF